ncbi:MAG: hypothetical protein KJ850_02800 [Gammaproteobacteria bacterium]|nr:hypothetical protein [Gammaproteobacteria bacterium]MBU1623953.1 hypothetical protein [Gammaproteobacteria bacterium]MBU1982170.1 hypothetical protein [Gammaproteobacteria bacterium]
MFKRTALTVLVLAALPMQAYAADGMFRLDAHVSTLGGGLEIGAPLSERYTARVGFNSFKASGNTDSGGLNYTGDLKLSSISALVDWRPWSGVTHLTAGVIFNSNKLELNATATTGTVYSINGFDYTAATGDAINTTVDFNKVSPYLGIGWSGQPKKQGFSFSSDIGILFQGSPKATVTATGAWTGTGGKTVTDLVVDAQNQLNSDLSNFKFYPVLSIGVGYTF